MLTMAGAFQATAGAVGCYVVAMLASKRLRSWTFAVLWTECLEGLLDRATRAHKRRFFSSLHLQGRILVSQPASPTAVLSPTSLRARRVTAFSLPMDVRAR